MKKIVFLLSLLLCISLYAEDNSSMFNSFKEKSLKVWDVTKQKADELSKTQTAQSIKDGTLKAWEKTKEYTKEITESKEAKDIKDKSLELWEDGKKSTADALGVVKKKLEE